MGDPVHNLVRALRRLGEFFGVERVDASPVYRTEPQLVREQPWFANQVVRMLCTPDVTPVGLLRDLLALEIELGRDRSTGEGAPERFGPRVIDLDLLAFGDVEMDTEELILPHPRLHERAFVLVPLCDLAPDLPLPSGKTTGQLLKALDFRLDGDKIFQE